MTVFDHVIKLCSLHVDPTLLHIQVKKKQTAALIFHSVTINVPTTNMPQMPHMQISSCAHETTISVDIPHMSTMQSTMSQQVLVYIQFTLLTYVPQQICLPHCIYMSDPLLLYSKYRLNITAFASKTSKPEALSSAVICIFTMYLATIFKVGNCTHMCKMSMKC